MIKTFVAGLVLGLVAAAALLVFAQPVNLEREASLITVEPNGGNREVFHVNLPADRIVAGRQTAAGDATFPAGLAWPDDAALRDAETEIFKLRNREDLVVGIAARVSNAKDPSGPFVQWMLHLPARGSMFVNLENRVSGAGYRNGLLVGGTREFAELTGGVRESYDSDVDSDEPGVSARLELQAALVQPLGEPE